MTASEITITRRTRANIADIWALWTTPLGLARWWGPQGFGMTVVSLDLRIGGELVYMMEARAPEMVAFMQANNMPTATRTVLRYTEVAAPNRLAFVNLVDFVPDHPPYETHTVLDLHSDGEYVVLRLATGRMHDDLWSERARMGWAQQLDKLQEVVLP